MKTLPAPHWPSVLDSFRIRSHGRIHVRRVTQRFGFQIRAGDCVPHPSMIFGLAQVESSGQRVRFAVRIDMESGEIWDAAHDFGLLGTLERSLWPSTDDAHPLVLRWAVEHAGSVLIPRLHVGDEEFLYPSQHFPSEGPFVAFTGHDLDEVSASAIFSPGYVWCQDRLK